MRAVVTQNQDDLRIWIERILFQKMPPEATFIGQMKDDRIVAVVAYCNFVQNACAMHIGSVGDNWMTRDLLWAAFDYPFNKLEKKVILATLAADNYEAVRLNRHLGFQEKCVIEDAHEDGDLMIMSMKREDCKWLNLNAPLRKLKGD